MESYKIPAPDTLPDNYSIYVRCSNARFILSPEMQFYANFDKADI